MLMATREGMEERRIGEDSTDVQHHRFPSCPVLAVSVLIFVSVALEGGLSGCLGLSFLTEGAKERGNEVRSLVDYLLAFCE